VDKGEDVKHCYVCGVEEPEYRVNGYLRDCLGCGGEGSVLSLHELLDIVNEIKRRGLLGELSIEDHIEEEYNKEELDFDNENDIIRAESDAMTSYLEEEYGDY
jgi:hypothetical protein